MSELVFATVIAELKTSWAESISDPEMIELLYDAVALPVGLLNQNGDAITVPKGAASTKVTQTSRVEEYIYILELGNSSVQPGRYNMLEDEIKKEPDRPIEWLGFRRRAPQAKRNSRVMQLQTTQELDALFLDDTLVDEWIGGEC